MNNFRYDSGIPLHPNLHRLAFSIKEELVTAIDDAICCSIGTEVRKKPCKKVKILKEKRLKLMLKLEKRDIDLRSFMVSIGSISLKHEKIMHTEKNFVSKDIEAPSETQSENESELQSPGFEQRKSLSGQDLRNFRSNYTLSQCQIKRIPFTQPALMENNNNKKISIIEATQDVVKRLNDINFELSPSQPQTPGDGNCYLHGIIDQIGYDTNLKQLDLDIHSLRKWVVNNLKVMILTKKFEWIDGFGSQEQWVEEMSKTGTQADEVFIRLSSEILNRKIEIYPIYPEDGHNASGKIIIEPKVPNTDDDPLYLLYYSEHRFTSGHYQSIRPCMLVEPLPKSVQENHDQRKKSKKTSRQESYIDSSNILPGKRRKK